MRDTAVSGLYDNRSERRGVRDGIDEQVNRIVKYHRLDRDSSSNRQSASMLIDPIPIAPSVPEDRRIHGERPARPAGAHPDRRQAFFHSLRVCKFESS